MHGFCINVCLFCRRVLSDQFAIVKQTYFIGHLTSTVHIMSHHKNGLPIIGKVANDLMKFVNGARIQAGRGLIQEQDVCITQYRQCNRNPLTHSFRVITQFTLPRRWH